MIKRILLLTPPTASHRTAEETVALGYLGTILRNDGYEVAIIDSWLEGLSTENLVSRIAIGARPDLVGMSCYHSNLAQADETLNEIRKVAGNIPAICGGYGPTFHGEAFLQRGFTVAVIGEAEHVILPLVGALSEKKELDTVSGITFYRGSELVRTPCSDPVVALDEIRFPARDTIRHAISQRNYIHVCTSRGCKAHCNYCSVFSFALKGSADLRWRQRGIVNIVDEIESLYDEYGVTHFKFVDDSFIEPPRDENWASSFCNELARRRLSIKFRTQVRADRLTKGLVQTLKAAGWFSTSLGVENASETALKRMRKSASVMDNERALKLLTENEIYITMGMILFDPYTTMKELQENLVFLKEHPWPITKGVFTEMYAAEGTAFTHKLRKSGVLQPSIQRYRIQDSKTYRMYEILKRWHRAHSETYDWIIDSLTAPKVLQDKDYPVVHALCRRLQTYDCQFFELALAHVVQSTESDADLHFTDEAIHMVHDVYHVLEKEIALVYRRNEIRYEAVPNPFL